jgi:acetylornithine deacetylase/succinyl-diaminopimelate desuccinylase-like protein
MATLTEDPTAEVTDLIQQLIRNACVNDGKVESGGEVRSVYLLDDYLGRTGLDVERFEPMPGRSSLVARIEGTDPTAPSLLLMGHTDVVPVNIDGWSRDPFAAEVVDGFVWGRGAIDMLNLTASQAVAFRRLAQSGFKPRGTLIYLAVADEEALGTWGAKWLVDHERDAVYADYVLTESGGWHMPGGGPPKLPVLVAEKGTFWSKLRIRGTPGHGSQPLRTDNALVTAAEVVRRISEYRPQTQINDIWRRFVGELNFPAEVREALVDPASLYDFVQTMPLGMARIAHACTHTTFAPTVMHGGTKTNVIPDFVELEVDIRTLPGQTGDEVRAMLREALGDLADAVEIESNDDPSTSSPVDTPLWDSLARTSAALCKDSALVPSLMVGGTDNRFFRRAGSVGYGFGLFSNRLPYEDFAVMFHGNDEKVDQESLALSTQLWEAVAHDLIGQGTE